MRRPGGYAVIVEPGKAVIEKDSFTCAHCNCVVFVEPRTDPVTMGGFCTLCMALTCERCATQACHPFERKLLAWESADKLRRAIAG